MLKDNDLYGNFGLTSVTYSNKRTHYLQSITSIFICSYVGSSFLKELKILPFQVGCVDKITLNLFLSFQCKWVDCVGDCLAYSLLHVSPTLLVKRRERSSPLKKISKPSIDIYVLIFTMA